MKTLYLAAASMLLAHHVHAEWQPAPQPAACDVTAQAFQTMKEEGYQPWIMSKLQNDGVTLVMMVWRGVDNDIAVTTTRIGTQYTCLVAIGDKDTVILDLMPTKNP